MLTDVFCNDSNSNNKINNINNNNICPKGTYTQRARFFFFCKYKEIHRMILYTTYNKYCVSYILLVEWMYVGVVFVSLFFSQFAFFPVCGFFSSSHVCYSHRVSPSFDGGVGEGWVGRVEGDSGHKLGLLMSLLPPAPLPPCRPRDAGGCGASSAP